MKKRTMYADLLSGTKNWSGKRRETIWTTGMSSRWTNWYVCQNVSSKYTRSKVKSFPKNSHIIQELLHENQWFPTRRNVISTIISTRRADDFIIAPCNLHPTAHHRHTACAGWYSTVALPPPHYGTYYAIIIWRTIGETMTFYGWSRRQRLLYGKRATAWLCVMATLPLWEDGYGINLLPRHLCHGNIRWWSLHPCSDRK